MERIAEQIAGHRIVRVVREEGDRRVLAAFGDEAVALHVAAGSGAAALAEEAEALLAVQHPHLLPVLDVAAVDGAVVLVRPMTSETAASWLLARTAPRVGEAVTIAAPVLDAVGALHAAGAIAGRVDLRSVVLDDDGAPAIEGIGARIVTDRPTIAWRETDASVAADCEALQALVGELLSACGELAPASVSDALDARDAHGASAALLAAWSASPVEHGAAERGLPVRAPRERQRPEGRATVLVAWAQRALAQLALVRRPVWIAAGAGAVALLVAVVLAGAGASEADPPAARPSASAAPAPEASTPGGMPAPESAAVDAAAALLAARERCLDDGDDACLAAILDPSGGAGSSTWRLPADAGYAEVAVLGDAVLVDVASSSEPASVLVVRTDAGWMLRDAWAA